MGLLDDFREDVASDAVFGELSNAQVVTYIPRGTTPGTQVDAIVRLFDTVPEFSTDGRQEVVHGVVQLKPADAADPKTGDQFTIGGVTYAAVAVPRREGLVEFQVQKRSQRRVGGADSFVER